MARQLWSRHDEKETEARETDREERFDKYDNELKEERLAGPNLRHVVAADRMEEGKDSWPNDDVTNNRH